MPKQTKEPVDGASSERYVIPNLKNACRVLKLLREHPAGLKAADLARALGIPVTTTMRIATTLQLEGLVQKIDGRYALGPVLIYLGNAALAGTDIRRIALPILKQLAADSSETAHLAVPCNERSLIIAVEESPHPLRVASSVGFLTDLHSSSTGKVFLAYVFNKQYAQFKAAESPYKHTEHTLTRRSEIEREIERIRARGYAVDDEECHIGVRCVAAPIYSPTGSVLAAIGTTASTVRLTEKRLPEMASKVIAAANEVSSLLGYSGAPQAHRRP
jgi:IclR family acetate operon transcriptional repressor